MNNLSIAGRIGKVGEMKYTQSGKAVLNISVATDNGKDGNGEKRAATWFEVALWEKTAESLEQYLNVGDRIGITGQVRLQVDTGADGTKYPKLVIDFPRVELMGGSQQATTAAPARAAAAAAPARAAARPAQRPAQQRQAARPAQQAAQEILDEDIPF
jgi:single-strand DNA-binding protein